jgi:hypothetical protein
MNFITKRTSETGKKFEAIVKRIDEAFNVQKKLAKEFGAKQWRPAYWVVAGGFSALDIDSEKVDKKIWKNVNSNEWMPRLTTKEGKEIQQRFDAMPKVTRGDLNTCIGFNDSLFRCIGFTRTNKEYFGFIVGDDWGVKIPSDCEEVTVSRYKELFKKRRKRNLLLNNQPTAQVSDTTKAQ